MNPIKELGKVLPGLKDVLESIHAHLEHLLVEEKKQTALLQKISESGNFALLTDAPKDQTTLTEHSTHTD